MKKQFKDLTVKGQRTRIIKDAIAQIECGKFIAQSGSYLNFDFDYDLEDELDEIQSLKKLINHLGVVCECCALGSIFTSCISEVNKVTLKNDYNDGEFQRKKLKKWFTLNELYLIETAFEKEIITYYSKYLNTNYFNTILSSNPTEIAKKAIRFGKRYKSDKNRLLAILNNILINKTFTP